MNFWSFALLTVVVAAVLVRGLLRRGGILEYPFLVAATMAGWFMPQALLLMENPSLPEFGYEITMGMAALSMLAVLFGNRYFARSSAADPFQYAEARLLIGAAVLSGIGAAAFALILRTPIEQTEEGLTTGIVTIYFFFFTAQFFGLALSLMIFLRRYSPLAAAIVAFDYFTMSGFVLFGGRRGPLVELALITLCALWFQRRILPPRALFILGIAGSALFVNAAGEYRGLVSSINEYQAEGQARLPTFDELMRIDFVGSFASGDPRRTDEVRNAIFDISATLETMGFRLGLDYWNYLVFRYVPAQIVGRDVKEAMRVELPDLAAQAYGYRRWIGTTHTGFADAFMSFGPAGALVFGLVSALLAGYWRRAMNGSLKAQYFYCILITTGLHAITHSTAWFVVFVPQAFGFSWILFRWAQSERGPRSRLVEPRGLSRSVVKRDAPSSLRGAGKPQAATTHSCKGATKP
jgi:hypothetical protein